MIVGLGVRRQRRPATFACSPSRCPRPLILRRSRRANYTWLFPTPGGPMASDTLTITDNRTGKQYDVPITDGHHPRDGAAQDQSVRGRLRVDDVRPGVHEHRGVPKPRSPTSTATRASCGTGATRSSSSPRSDIPRDGVPAAVRRAADRRAARRRGRTTSRHHTIVHENMKKLMDGFQLRRPSDGRSSRHGRRALDLLPGRQGHPTSVAAPADRTA